MKCYMTLLLMTVLLSNKIHSQIQPKISWIKTYNGPGDGVEILNDAVLDKMNNLYLAGRGSGPDLSQDIYHPGYFFISLRQPDIKM